MTKIIKKILFITIILASTNATSSEHDFYDPESTIDSFYTWGLNKEAAKQDIIERLPTPEVIDEGANHIIFSIGDKEVYPINLLLEFNDNGELSEATTLTDSIPDDTADMLQAYFNSISYIEQNYNGESETSFFSSEEDNVDGESIADLLGLVKAVSEGKLIIESKINLNRYEFVILVMPTDKVKEFNPNFKFSLKENIVMASSIISNEFKND